MSLVQYRDHTIRNNAWEEIAEQMNKTVEECKDKWAKLRNCFTNALKRHRKKSGQAATAIIPWKFEAQMQFLSSHLDGRRTITNLAPSDENSEIPYSELQLSEESATSAATTVTNPTPTSSSAIRTPTTSSSAVRSPTPCSSAIGSPTPSRSTKRKNDNDILKDMVNVMKSSQEMRRKITITEMNETDYFFMSMSKQLQNLPKVDQAKIKFELHKLIHESEINMLNSRERLLKTPLKVTRNQIILSKNTSTNVTHNQHTTNNITSLVAQEEKAQEEEIPFNITCNTKRMKKTVIPQCGSENLFMTQHELIQTQKEELPIKVIPSQTYNSQIVTMKNPLNVTTLTNNCKIKKLKFNKSKFQKVSETMLPQYESEDLYVGEVAVIKKSQEEKMPINVIPNQIHNSQNVTVKSPLNVTTGTNSSQINKEKFNNSKYQILSNSMRTLYESQDLCVGQEEVIEAQEDIETCTEDNDFSNIIDYYNKFST